MIGERRQSRCWRERRDEKIYRRIMHVLLNAGYYNISTWWTTHSAYYYDKCSSCGSREWHVPGALHRILKSNLETGWFFQTSSQYSSYTVRHMSFNFNFTPHIMHAIYDMSATFICCAHWPVLYRHFSPQVWHWYVKFLITLWFQNATAYIYWLVPLIKNLENSVSFN